MNSLALRVSIPILIVILALCAFKSGVQVAYRPELGDQPIGILVFHIISFFTFGAKDYGPPVAGPEFWQYVIYFVYYAAPLNFLSIIAEAIYLLSKPLLPLLLYKKKHYLIIGYGRVGKAAEKFLREKEKNCRIIILDNNQNELPSGMNLFRWKLLFLKRDMNEPDPFQDLRLNHCKGIFILTDREWLNIKLFYDIKSAPDVTNKDFFVFTRVSSVDLMNQLNQKREMPDSNSKIGKGDYFFNIHAAASRQLFDEPLNYTQGNQGQQKDKEEVKEEFQRWRKSGIESVVFFGFGRFSSEFLFQLQSDGIVGNSLKSIIIVDPRAEESWKQFNVDYPYRLHISPTIVRTGMENLAMLESTFAEIDLGHSLAVFGSDDEIANIKYSTAFHKIYDKKDSLHYILRTKTSQIFSPEVLKTFLGNNYLLVPTYEWIKDYFHDQFKLDKKKNP